MPERCREEARCLLYRAHQARHYQTPVAFERVKKAAVLLGRHMQRPRVRRVGASIGVVPEDHVQVSVPAVRTATPEPVAGSMPATPSSAKQDPTLVVDTPPSSTRSVLGRLRDVFGF